MLYYHKCNDCLTPFASTEQKIDLCDCMGTVSFMGIVHGDKWEKVENRPACDGRCTHAHGPHCDCECGGVNHGTGRVVATVVAEGKVKVVSSDDDIMEEMKRGYRFRELRDKVEELFDKVFGAMHEWAYDRVDARRQLNKALQLKVYERREQELLKLAVKFAASIVKTEE